MRHASSTPSLYLSLTSRLPCRHPTPSPPAVLVAVNSSYLPTRSPHTPPETPNHHSATPSGLVRRAPRLLLHTTADHPATSRKVCLNRIQSIARLPCLLSAVSRPVRPVFRKAGLQPIYRQSIRFPCDSLRLLALCTRIPRSPSFWRAIVRGAGTSRSRAYIAGRAIPRSLIREVEHNLDTYTGSQPRDVMRSECGEFSPGYRHAFLPVNRRAVSATTT